MSGEDCCGLFEVLSGDVGLFGEDLEDASRSWANREGDGRGLVSLPGGPAGAGAVESGRGPGDIEGSDSTNKLNELLVRLGWISRSRVRGRLLINA